MRRRIPIAFPVVIGVIGVILIVYSLLTERRSRAVESWATTPGIVIDASINSDEKIRERRQSVKFYSPGVQYTYKVGRREFVSDKIWIHTREQPDPEEARRVVASYPTGKAVLVHYNPKDPADSVLEVGTGSATSEFLGCGIALAVVSALMFGARYLWRRSARQN